MAFSANTIDFDRYHRVVTPDLDTRLPLPLQLAQFWSHLNLQTAQEAEKTLGSRYRCIRLEDLCAEPETCTRSILNWLGASDLDAAKLGARVKTPGSLGRWHDTEAKLEAEIEAAARPALEASRDGWSPTDCRRS